MSVKFQTVLGLAVASLVSAAVTSLWSAAIAAVIYEEVYSAEVYATGLVTLFLYLGAIAAVVFWPIQLLLRQTWPSSVAYGLAGAVLGCVHVAVFYWLVRSALNELSLPSADVPIPSHGMIEIASICILSMGVLTLTFWFIRRPDRDPRSAA